jgi:N-acetylmuramoyl-L-alanine amidase
MRNGLISVARWLGGHRRLAVAGLAVSGAALAAATVHGQTSVGVLKVRIGGDSHQTRMVIELDRPTKGQLLSGSAPADRVNLTLAHLDVPGDMQGEGAGLVKAWRVEEAAGAAQVHLDLAHAGVVRRRFLLPPADGVNVYRYVIDVTDQPAADTAAPSNSGQTNPAQVASIQPGQPAPQQELHAAKGSRRARQIAQLAKVEAPPAPLTPSKKVIVIDAGHGGHDPGAAGAHDHEKDLTLAAAKALRDRLEREGRYHVVLTRTDDTYVALEDRVRIARRANADLFISLHADSGTSPDLKGATVYTLSEQGASRAAKQVFEKANWIAPTLPGADDQVNRILLDLTQRETRNRSSEFAETLLERISDKAPLLRRSHRDAGFMVLLAPDVPAVLLEMGFITNPTDERRLADGGDRRRLMDGVAQAIDTYFAGETMKVASR